MRWFLVCVALGCSPVPASSDLVPEPTKASVEPARPVSGGWFDFDRDDRDEDAPAATPEPAELTVAELIEGQGLSSVVVPSAEAVPSVAAPAPPPVVAPPVPSVPAPSPFSTVLPAPVTWGVRLVSTVPGSVPPRAILGLLNGREAVVQPGTLLEDAKIVVLAVGVDQVQIARVIAEGDSARVEVGMLTSMYPSTAQR